MKSDLMSARFSIQAVRMTPATGSCSISRMPFSRQKSMTLSHTASASASTSSQRCWPSRCSVDLGVLRQHACRRLATGAMPAAPRPLANSEKVVTAGVPVSGMYSPLAMALVLRSGGTSRSFPASRAFLYSTLRSGSTLSAFQLLQCSRGPSAVATTLHQPDSTNRFCDLHLSAAIPA